MSFSQNVVCHKVVDVSDANPGVSNTLAVETYSGGILVSTVTGELASYSSSNPLNMTITTGGSGFIILDGDNFLDYRVWVPE